VIDARGDVLVVDDDPTILEVVVRYLEHAGLHVAVARDGRAALDAAIESPPDLVILDLMLPEVDGLEVCRRLQALAPVPVIMLTAKGDESDRIIGLDIGADDYITKPFSPRELVARAKAVLRRASAPLTAVGAEASTVLIDGDLRVEVRSRDVTLAGRPIRLTAREFELLVFLMRHPRQAFRRETLLERVWGTRYGDTSTITVHIRRIREKIEEDPSRPMRIGTIWGVGYRWEGQAPRENTS
jgi:DNA-binding response OmpR family regulator